MDLKLTKKPLVGKGIPKKLISKEIASAPEFHISVDEYLPNSKAFDKCIDTSNTTAEMDERTKFQVAQVTALREMTGAGIMDCKKAYHSANGDMEKALDILKHGTPIRILKKGR